AFTKSATVFLSMYSGQFEIASSFAVLCVGILQPLLLLVLPPPPPHAASSDGPIARAPASPPARARNCRRFKEPSDFGSDMGSIPLGWCATGHDASAGSAFGSRPGAGSGSRRAA